MKRTPNFPYAPPISLSSLATLFFTGKAYHRHDSGYTQYNIRQRLFLLTAPLYSGFQEIRHGRSVKFAWVDIKRSYDSRPDDD